MDPRGKSNQGRRHAQKRALNKTPLSSRVSRARVLYQLAITRQRLDGVVVGRQSLQDTWDLKVKNVSMLAIYVCTGNLEIAQPSSMAFCFALGPFHL